MPFLLKRACRRGWQCPVRSTALDAEPPVKLARHRLIAFARCPLKRGSVKNGHLPAQVTDNSRLLKGRRHDADGWPMHAQHVGHEFLRQIKGVAFGAVMQEQQPARESLLDRMQAVAGHRLRNLAEVSPQKTLGDAAQRRIALDNIPENGSANAQAVAGY